MRTDYFNTGVKLTPQEKQAAQDSPVRPEIEIRGVTGTKQYGGLISEETNPALLNPVWAQTAMEMLRTDAIISGGWTAIRQTLLSAEWAFEPQPGGSKEIAEWADAVLGTGGRQGGMIESFEAVLSRIFLYYPIGFRYAEPIWKILGDEVRVNSLADRVPAAHWRWELDENGQLFGVSQLPPYSSVETFTRQQYFIPANKLLVFTHQFEGANFEGVGALRPLWWPWQLKRDIFNIAAIGYERWAIGTPIAEYDPSVLQQSAQEMPTMGFGRQGIEQIISRTEETLKNYISHKSSWMSTVKGVTISSFGGDGRAFDVSAAVAFVQHLNQEMLQALLTQFLLLGINNTGSRAVGDSHLDFFRASAINILDYVASVLDGPASPGSGLMGRLYDWNFPALLPGDRPRLRHQGVDSGRLLANLGSLAQGVGAGLLTPTPDVEAAIRRDAKLDPVKKDGKAQ